MNPKIYKLSQSVINQIAAGEVVENPASIVKELIENSLDANAKKISVEIVGGGAQLIRVEDDGCGMSPEDALLSLERHATSKIQTVDDLQTLLTMGFRGEALAAISSVCHFELKTSDGKGTKITSEGGKITSVEPYARNLGTTIEVRSLFYNVPARKKFQKSPSVNAAQVTRVVEAIALAHPEIAFVFNSREFNPTNFKKRIEEILGEYEHEVKAELISGFVAAPSKATATRTGQYVYINKRPLFSPLISKAVKEAFGTRIGEQKFPRFVLFLELSPDLIDVNVHPQKREVRFREEGWIFSSVQKAIENVLIPQRSFTDPISFTMPPAFSFKETALHEPFKLAEEKLEITFPERPLAVLGSYLLIQKEHLMLVDLKAAFARLLFDSLTQEKALSQALLWPLEIALEPGENVQIETLQRFGIECRILKRTLLIDALPPFLEECDFPQFFTEWRLGKKLEQITARFCNLCQKKFSLDQAVQLWRQTQTSLYDPLGKSISKSIDEEDLARILHG